MISYRDCIGSFSSSFLILAIFELIITITFERLCSFHILENIVGIYSNIHILIIDQFKKFFNFSYVNLVLTNTYKYDTSIGNLFLRNETTTKIGKSLIFN